MIPEGILLNFMSMCFDLQMKHLTLKYINLLTCKVN